MSDQKRHVAKLAALVAGGAVFGAGIGMLLAPQSGAETRREVSRYTKNVQLKATRLSRSIRSRLIGAMDQNATPAGKDGQRTTIAAA